MVTRHLICFCIFAWLGENHFASVIKKKNTCLDKHTHMYAFIFTPHNPKFLASVSDACLVCNLSLSLCLHPTSLSVCLSVCLSLSLSVSLSLSHCLSPSFPSSMLWVPSWFFVSFVCFLWLFCFVFSLLYF